MHRSSLDITIASQAADVADYTVAVSNIFTSVGHGLATNDRIQVDTTGSIPGGILGGVIYYVKKIDADTFTISLTAGGADVDVTDTGTGTQSFYREVVTPGLDVSGYDQLVISFDTSAGSSGATLKARGTIAATPPDFAAPQTETNHWDNLAMTDLELVSTNRPAMIKGDTGAAFTSAAHNIFRIDTRGLRWVGFVSDSFASGTLVIKGKLIESIEHP